MSMAAHISTAADDGMRRLSELDRPTAPAARAGEHAYPQSHELDSSFP